MARAACAHSLGRGGETISSGRGGAAISPGGGGGANALKVLLVEVNSSPAIAEALADDFARDVAAVAVDAYLAPDRQWRDAAPPQPRTALVCVEDEESKSKDTYVASPRVATLV